ncbi:vacuolar amino acid transporter-like protein 1 [Pseudovirgaria hyperparasitica]|uniref:Vacuolar amino acid transporter-like protein 1 n=1 Tax=Pseudovirgaria hyperparasitica TaxID=470096 RepID=A0A6A6W2P8_9PEZI|nr:vacuolar amino acid transporter-like protein 1 [Pseudovirgaria hyperparasitica]KAF2755867.1 vacuolar amino acid transporter-like protein 1 [Pseudovirgaria hyperparasitica]
MDINDKRSNTIKDYEQGRYGSFSSTGSHIQWDESSERPGRASRTESPHMTDHNGQLRHRRSSLSMRIQNLADAGGVNSLNNFARSWQRAVGFHEITHVRNSFRISDTGDDDDTQQDDVDTPTAETGPRSYRSLLRSALEEEGRRASNEGATDHAVEDDESTVETSGLLHVSGDERRRIRDESIFSIEPSLSSPFGGSYGTMYGSLGSRINDSAKMHAGRLFTEQQLKGVTEPDEQREPLLVKQVEEDGQIINVVVGQSTLPQTIFNSVNVLIGVGLLSLPLALKYSGLLIGLIFFTYSAVATAYTAKLLAKCLDVDNSLITFADLAFVSFGKKARIATSILFSLELIAACVALIILFADSLNALIPGWGVTGWKILCGLILIPIGFLPLRLLSFTSILGILCCLSIFLILVVDGLIKPEQPGSLLEPAQQYLFPENWLTIPLSFGLLMSPWGGHSVFPNIYRDMRHSYKYRKAINITYSFTLLLDLGMAVIGILMFGEDVRDEITSNIFMTSGYPAGLSVILAICIAIIPLTKVPLNARPIISTVEIFCGIDSRAIASTPSMAGMSGWNRGLLMITIRVIMYIVFVLIAIVFPSFDRIMTLLGAIACFTICIILPLAFHLKLFGKEMRRRDKAFDWTLLIVSVIMAVVSTVFACLPKDLIGA